jgi:hypothetical protein
MPPRMKDLALDPGVRVMLHANGTADALQGIPMRDGWLDICEKTGFYNGRTPARELYEDGYYSVPADKHGSVKKSDTV